MGEPNTCGLCGHDPACGSASAPPKPDAENVPLCHADDHSCYHRWTVYRERPMTDHAPLTDEELAALTLMAHLCGRTERGHQRGWFGRCHWCGINMAWDGTW